MALDGAFAGCIAANTMVIDETVHCLYNRGGK